MTAKTPAWSVNPQPQVTHYVNSVAISANAGTVVGGTYYHAYNDSANHKPSIAPSFPVGVFAYDKTGKGLWSHVFSATEGVYWVALSRDGAWAASGGLITSSPYQGFIYAYDAIKGSNQLLASPAVRTNMVIVFIISIFVNIGMWFERFVIIVTSLHRDYLPPTGATSSRPGWTSGLSRGRSVCL